MKRIFAIVLCGLMLLTVACAKTDTADTTTAAPTAEVLEEQGIKNIIIVIGDGMGPNQVKSGEIVSGKQHVFADWDHTLVNTNSLDSNGEPLTTTDSAASSTALATGTLTTNGRVGQDASGKELKTIMDYAQEYGKATGVITTDAIYGATPSGFSGHSESRNNYDDIMRSQLSSGIDLFCAKYTAEAMEKRYDIANAGYTLCDSIYEARDSLNVEKAYWLLNVSGHTATDKLSKVTETALQFLSRDTDGFVLMIEQANIDGHGHSNEFNGLPQCVNILNDTVSTVLNWVGDRTDTAILVTADHETGGLQISTEPDFANKYTCANGDVLYYNFTTTNHTSTCVDLFTYGFNPDFTKYYTEDRPDAIKNINIFDMMLDILQDPMQEG